MEQRVAWSLPALLLAGLVLAAPLSAGAAENFTGVDEWNQAIQEEATGQNNDLRPDRGSEWVPSRPQDWQRRAAPRPDRTSEAWQPNEWNTEPAP